MSRPASSETITHGIRIQAAAEYQAEESDPDSRHWLYVYRIRMRNEGTERARLKSRYWLILDANNERREVRGPGVVGRYPDLGPGESYEYFSSCPLSTPWGTMEGAFTFEREDGTPFEVAVGRFFLVPSAPPVLARKPARAR